MNFSENGWREKVGDAWVLLWADWTGTVWPILLVCALVTWVFFFRSRARSTMVGCFVDASTLLCVGFGVTLGASYVDLSLREAARDRIADRFERDAPWFVQAMWKSGVSWVAPFGLYNSFDLAVLTGDLAGALQREFRRFQQEDLSDRALFDEGLDMFSTIDLLCSAEGAHHGGAFRQYCDSGRFDEFERRLAVAYHKHHAQSTYVTRAAGRLKLAERRVRALRVCNFAPFAVRLSIALPMASEATRDLNNALFGLRLDAFRVEGWRILGGGECLSIDYASYDNDAAERFFALAEDLRVFEWVNANAPGLGEGERSILGEFGLSLNLSDRFCVQRRDFRTHQTTARACADGARAVDFSIATALDASRSYAAVQHLGFIFMELAEDGRVMPVARANERAVLGYVKVLAANVTRQIALEAAWRGRVPRFVVGGRLVDANGPMVPGVSASGLPRRTLYDEPLATPTSGEVIGVNSQNVWSLLDVHDALERHGGDRAAGIDVLYTLTLRTGSGAQGYPARFFFNANAQQEFSQSMSGTQVGLEHCGAYGSEALACSGIEAGKAGINMLYNLPEFLCRIVNDVDQCGGDYAYAVRPGDLTECTFVRVQRAAYYLQVQKEDFEVGCNGSILLPTGVSVLRLFRGSKAAKFAKGSKGIRLTQRVAGGVAEAIDNVIWEIGNAAPSTPLIDRIAAAKYSAGLGFVMGSASGL